MMSKQAGVLEIDKCIVSRLWYTSLVVYQTYNNIEKYVQQKTSVDSVPESEALIKRIIQSQGENQHNWICQVLLNKLLNNVPSNIKYNVWKQSNRAQILYALQLYANIPSHVQQELLLLYEANQKEKSFHNIEKVYARSLTFLMKNADQNPMLTCWIINELLNGNYNIVYTVQDLYVSILQKLLEQISLSETYDCGSEVEQQKIICNRDHFGALLCILAKMNIIETETTEFSSWLYPTLLKICSTTDVGLAFLSRESKRLFNEWCIFLDDIYARTKIADSLENALKIREVMFEFKHDSITTLRRNELLQRVTKTKLHWFTDILGICYALITNGRYDDVSTILSCPLLKHFWPILLFKVLNEYPQEKGDSTMTLDNSTSVCKSVKLLIQKCNFDASNDSALRELNTMLQKHVKIVECILNWDKTSLTIKDTSETEEKFTSLTSVGQVVSVKQIFFLLQYYNILAVLKTITNLHEQDYDKIRSLLKDLDESEDVFKAYSSILCALKAVLLCESYSSKHVQIANCFYDMKRYLHTLHPLSLRLKVIEDIFSLLFLRHEDFDLTQNNSDEDSISTSDEKPRFDGKLVEQPLTGFICNKYAIRDMLLHLRECVFAARVEHAKYKDDHGITDEVENIERNISSITAAIIDAKWRLELFTNLNFVENMNSPDDADNSSLIISKTETRSKGKPSFLNRLKDSPCFYHYDSTSDETKLRSDSGSESGQIISNTKWRRSLMKHIAGESSTTKDYSKKPSFVSLMLASKESLIVQCLWKNDYAKAQEVLEMSESKNVQLNAEVSFSKALHKFKENFKDKFKHIDSPKNENLAVEHSQSSTLENIRAAAQEGVHSSRHTSQLETFLASQEMHLRLLSVGTHNSNEMITLCALDLTLTMSQISASTGNLCDVAMKYVKLCKAFENSEYSHFFFKIYQLFYEKKDESSLTDILCDAKIPLSVKEYMEKNDFWHEVITRHREFNKSQANKDTINKILKDNNYLPGLKILSRITGICNSIEKYLHGVCSHLQLLHTIIPTNDMIFTVSDLLKLPLHHYFGHQIFDLKVEPSKLETVAQSLQVNLVYSILINACPKLDYQNTVKYTTNNKDNGCIILNKNLDKMDSNYVTQGPNQCVSEILTELLEVLHTLCPGQSTVNHATYKTISRHPYVQAALKKTSRLAKLDLSELSVGAETLTFFLNTWNIMFLHINLTVWSNVLPANNLWHTVSLMSYGYIIGDLGLVTLAALRSKLLNDVMLDNAFFIEIEELNEPAWQDLDIVQDIRTIFAMANEFYGTPRIRVYDAKSLNNDLSDAFHEYLDYYSSAYREKFVQTSEKQKTVVLPDLVRQYECFLSRSSQGNAHNIINVQDLLSAEDYFKHFDKNIVIQYIASSHSYNIILRYTGTPRASQQKKIDLHTPVWKNRSMRSSLLQYLEGHCWILSYLLQRIHNENPTILENNCDHLKRTACLENLFRSSWIAEVKPLFDGNKTLAAIHETILVQKLWSYFETALKNNKWHSCLGMINSLPDNILIARTELQCFKDKILSNIVSKKEAVSSAEVLRYLYQIKDIHVLAQTVLFNISKWHVHVCENALLHVLHHVDNYKLPMHCKLRMNETLHRVLIFHKMLPYCISKSNSTWYDVAYCTEKIDPFQIIKSLITADKYELCLEWLECQAFSLEIQSSVTQDFLIGLLRNEAQNFKQALKLLRVLPLSQSVKMCKNILKKLESIDALQFVANYLLEHCKATETIKYRRTLVGIDILRMLETKDRPLYIHLIKEPLLMLEQLLMNCKFESIQKILNKIREKLAQVDISINSFDKIIRFYAEKSLDFRVSLQRDSAEGKSRNIQQSTSEVESTEFVMPVVVPTKEEWVPNEKARECSCCKTVIFSMFNRRHHCRRCGRVICAMCSQHRMQVPGYAPSVPVRVCDDCKRQTVLQMRAVQGSSCASSSEMFDYWRLTRDQTHNQTIREEFSFEYAPNISLCLAILNLHSDHKAYTSFLLDRCDEMKRLLQPVGGGRVNPEIDHTVIIKMIRCLLVAAKVKCAKLGLNTGLAHCDRFLSQVDLIATLVQSDCIDLIPSDNLDEHTLRKLRDVLIEKEQWTLALDVSTKAGLDTQGVWATWGKACLKMGYFDQARDKFFHCLDKIVYDDLDDWVVLSYPKAEPFEITPISATDREIKADEPNLKKLEFVKNRPLKDPPLLTDILQILDNLNVHRYHMQHPYQYKLNAGQDILATLPNLKIASQIKFFVRQTSSVAQNIHYQESLYYLLTYGSYNSILEFFLKHEEFDKCLAFVLENDLEPESFFNSVYMYCLRYGTTEKLHDAIKSRDSTLLIWKKYLICVCHNLEKRQYLHILYQLQLFMKDSVRAAMTCIRFYVNEANNYADLCSRGHLLYDAQKHLESELQIESLSRRRKKSTSSLNNNQGILTMEMEPLEIDRHINTICRQMEIAKFLGNCEKEGRVPTEFLSLFPDVDYDGSKIVELPTLFGNQQQKTHLAVLAILCGRDIEEGFGIAFRIMQDYNLPQQKVYSLAGHVLALKNNIGMIEKLIKCCHTSGAPNSYVISDCVLTHCVKLLLNRAYSKPGVKSDVDILVRLITDIELKINAYIECKQLKAAYLLAVKHSRAQDIRKILKESDKLGQNAIKTICIKWLQQEPKL